MESKTRWFDCSFFRSLGKIALVKSVIVFSMALNASAADIPFEKSGSLKLMQSENYFTCSVIDRLNGFAYFGTNNHPAQIVKVRLSDFSRVDAIVLNTEETQLRSAVIDPMGQFAYFGTDTSPGRIVKIRLSDFTRMESIVLNNGEAMLRSAVIDHEGNFAYFGTDTAPGQIVKVQLSNMSRVGTITLAGGHDNLHAAVMDNASQFAYFATKTSPSEIVKVRLSDFAIEGFIQLGGVESDIECAAIDPAGLFAYFGTDSEPGRVIKVSLSDFTRVGSLELNSDGYLTSALVDSRGEFAYFGQETQPGRIAKVRLSNFTQVDTILMKEGELNSEGNLATAVIDTDKGYAYFGTNCFTASIIRIQLSDFTRKDALASRVGDDLLTSAVIDTQGGYAYFGTNTVPGTIVKVRLSDFERVGNINLEPGENRIVSGAIDVNEGFAYFGTETSPGRIIKVRLSDFTRQSAITLDSGEDNPVSAVIDSLRGFLYVGTESSSESFGKIVKVRLADFARVGNIVLNPGEDSLKSAVIDPVDGFAYFATSVMSNGKIIKVQLSDFSRVGTLENLEQYIRSAAIDTVNGYAYFGTASHATDEIIKVRLSDLSKVDQMTMPRKESYLTSAVIDPTTGYAYFGGFGNSLDPSFVSKIRLSDFTREGYISLDVGQNGTPSAVIDPARGYAYFGTLTQPGQIARIRIGVPHNALFPASLTASPTSSTQIDLTWTASTADGLAKYSVSRSGVVVSIVNATTTSFNDTDLAPFTLYNYEVKALDVAGNILEAATASATTLIAPPPAPASGTVDWVTNQSLAASWGTSDRATSYTLAVSLGDNNPPTNPITASSSGNNGSITDLDANTTYYFFVNASNAGGSSPYTSLGSTVTLANEPTSLTSNNLTMTSVGLSFTANGNPVGTTYVVEKKVGAGAFSPVLTTTSLTPTIPGLSSGITYFFQVRAKNWAGMTTGPSHVVSVVPPDTQAPTAPVTLTATAVSANQINLTWTASTDNVAVVKYWVYRGGVMVSTVNAPATSFNDTGLAPFTLYNYEVKALDGAGNISGAATVSATTPQLPPPPAPTKILVSGGDQLVSGRWNASIGATTYTLAASLNSDNPPNPVAGSAVVNAPSTNGTVNGLLANTSYYLFVNASNAGGSSLYTLLGSAWTLANVPTNLAIDNIAVGSVESSVRLSFSSNGNPAGTFYYVEMAIGDEAFRLHLGTTSLTPTIRWLSAGTTYRFRVRALNWESIGTNPSDIVTVIPTDTQAPTAPANLKAKASSASQINLTWTASTDNVEVVKYWVYRGGVVVSTVNAPATSFNDTGLDPATPYNYQVKALDATGNVSAPVTASATTLPVPDTTSPSAPTNLTATVPSASQINLTWTASTDNVEVVKYWVYRGGVVVSTVNAPATSFNDTGLDPATPYNYQVKALDATGNVSAPVTASATTLPVPDTTSPSAPTNLTATVPSASQINLTWTASTDNVEVVKYWVYRGGVVVSTVNAPATSYTDTGLAPTTRYNYQVKALDATGNASDPVTASATTLPVPDTTSPSAPTNLTATVPSASQINLTWTASTDNVEVVKYWVYRGGVVVSTVNAPATSFNDTGLDPTTPYNYQVKALDATGNVSDPATASATTLPVPDTTSPSAPTNLTATVPSASQINLTWTASTDNVEVVKYWVYRGGVVVSTVNAPATSYTDTGLAPTTRYNYQVKALDATGNVSAPVTASATTLPVPDTTSPTAPTNLTATVPSASQINLTWTASTDNVAVVKYWVYRGGVVVSTVNAPATSFNDTGLDPATPYNYQVKALDGVGNISAPATASATTLPVPDTTSPTAPTNLTATVPSASQINLTWTASTDNVEVVKYWVYRGGVVVSTVNAPATSFNDTGLDPATPYNYQVKALDGVGNISAPATASATTLPVPDTTSPSAPTNLTATVPSASQINLTWTASTDNVEVVKYWVYRGGVVVSTVNAPATSYTDTGLAPTTRYNYQVKALDAAGNVSAPVTASVATLAVSDTTPPSAPTNLTATVTSASQINLTWTASTDDVNVVKYLIIREGVVVSSVIAPTTSYNDAGLAPSTRYNYQVKALDAVGNVSSSAEMSVTTWGDQPPPPDTFHFSMSTVRAYPSPYRPGTGATVMTFDRLPPESRVRIYSVTGTRVTEFTVDDDGSKRWPVTNDSGEDVASGIYYVHVTGPGGNKIFKIMIQR